MEVKRSSKTKTAVSAIIPFVLLAVMIGYVFGPGSELISFGVVIPEISIELSLIHISEPTRPY